LTKKKKQQGKEGTGKRLTEKERETGLEQSKGEEVQGRTDGSG